MQGIKGILWNSKSKNYTWLASTFLIIGLFVSFLSLQITDYSNDIFSKDQQTNFIIVGKKASFLSSISGQVQSISNDEIDSLMSLESIDDVVAFGSNQFPLKAFTEGQFQLSLDLFFESVPDQWLDNQPSEFKWKMGQKFIPILISREILNMWNFGLSQSQNLPQLDLATITSIPFVIKIRGDRYEARIVGLTDRYPTVLVPHNFLLFANQNYAYKEAPNKRIILKTNFPADPILHGFLKRHQLDFNQDQVLKDKINLALTILVRIFSVIGVIFLILSSAIILLQLLLKVEQSKQQIRKLKLIGYDIEKIMNVYMKHLYWRIGLSTGLAMMLGVLGTYFLESFLNQWLIELETFIYWKNMIIIVIIPMLILVILKRKIKTSLQQIY